MNSSIEGVIVAAIVAVAIIYILRRSYSQKRGTCNACGPTCSCESTKGRSN